MNERPDRNDDPDNPYGGHRPDGLYVFGPVGMQCVLAALIAQSLLRVTGRTAYGERRVWIRERADDLRRRYTPAQLGEMERERRQSVPARMMRVGGFLKPSGKRPNSGRKRRVAA